MKEKFLDKFENVIDGIIAGFDRIILKGILKPIIHENGMQSFLYNNNVLNKNYKDYIKTISKIITDSAHEYTNKQIGCKTQYLNSCYIRKEEVAHNRQIELGIKAGLIGTFSCVESCKSFKSTFDKSKGFPKIEVYYSRCKHIYFYIDHDEYGFMSVHIQTWAPFNIQIALNGREWLKRMLEKEDCEFIKEKNKFIYISDYKFAQQKLNSQLNVDWTELLNQFVPMVFPAMNEILGNMEYTWTMDQSEWAKDYIFKSSDTLKPVMDDLLYYSFISDNAHNVFKYMNITSPKSDYGARVNKYEEGFCCKFKSAKNYLKFYSFLNNLRFEMIMNNPKVYKVNRFKMNATPNDKKVHAPMIKSVSLIPMRAEVSSNILNNFIEHLNSANHRDPLDNIFSSASHPLIKNGKRVRSIDILGKDKLLLQAISDPAFDVVSFSNKDLYKKLINSSWAKGMSGKKLSARITRHIKLLRDHGIIRKCSKQYRYYLTEKGEDLTSALNITLATSSENLLKMAS